MTELKGNESRIRVVAGAAGTPATVVGRSFDADFAREPQQATHNSYDTGAFVNRKVIRYDGDLTFKFFTDPADGGQDIIRAACMTATPAQITVDYGEDIGSGGFVAGKVVQRFTANVRIKRGAPVEGMAVTEVTLSPDGAITDVTLS
jgi:hypothetical protein